MPGPSHAAFCLLVSVGLSGCGDSSGNLAGSGTATSQDSEADADKGGGVSTLELADGPDVCFRAVAKQLGATAKVSEITSFFSAGSAIDSDNDEPQGRMTTCTVEYQSPADPRKLLSTSLDLQTGEFAPPTPVEISVMGGDANAFRLEDYLIPLSSVNAAALTSIMDGQKTRLGKVFSQYAWSGVRLSSPDAFSDVHTLRLDIDGRLASNDIKENGYASISTDGKRITADHLMP
jgi:hypothetical protein